MSQQQFSLPPAAENRALGELLHHVPNNSIDSDIRLAQGSRLPKAFERPASA